MTNIKVFGEWKSQGASFVKVDNAWRSISRSFVKIDGVWKDATLGSPPNKPTMTYVSTGVFQISNYDPALTYQAIFRVGSGGSATLNTSNGRYTLDNENSGFDVIARYSLGSLASISGYMERKKYSFSCRNIVGTCCESCCSLQGGNCFCVAPDANGCPPGTSPNGQCGCGGSTPCMGGSIGEVVCSPCNCTSCVVGTVCDVLMDEPGYINSGTEWYKVE